MIPDALLPPDHLAVINLLYGDAVRTAVDDARMKGWNRRQAEQVARRVRQRT